MGPRERSSILNVDLVVVTAAVISAELSHSFSSFGYSSKHDEICPESFGIVVCRFVGTVLDIWGLVWPSFKSRPGPQSKISGRILKGFRGPFSSAELSFLRMSRFPHCFCARHGLRFVALVFLPRIARGLRKATVCYALMLSGRKAGLRRR